MNQSMTMSEVQVANLTRGGYYNLSRGNGTGQYSSVVSQSEIALEPHSMVHLLLTSITLGLMILATVIGNVFVIAAVVLERNLHNVANYLIASLAVADLMVAALVMPLSAVNEVSTKWFLGPEVCDMWISFDVLCCTSSILHLVAIALDRYWAVTQVNYIYNRSPRRILGMVAISWVISVCISIPPLFGWKETTNNPNQTGLCLISQDWGYTVYSTVGAFYLPLTGIIIIYIKIFRAARKRIRKKNFKNIERMKPKISQEAESTTESAPTLPVVASSGNQSPEVSTNGSAVQLNDANRNNRKHVTPPSSPYPDRKQDRHKGSFMDIAKFRDKTTWRKKEKTKEKVAQKRERKAARTLGIITGVFILCWMPFFIVAVLRPFCGINCTYPDELIGLIGWLGYSNSLLNPIIYTIFNPDFRLAFGKILFGRYNQLGRPVSRRR